MSCDRDRSGASIRRVRAPRSGIDGDEGKIFGRLPALPLAVFEMAATLATVEHRIFMQRTERCNAIR